MTKREYTAEEWNAMTTDERAAAMRAAGWKPRKTRKTS